MAAGGEQLARLEAIGRAATRAGRSFKPKAGASVFGAKSRDARRRQLQGLRRSMCLSIEGLDKEQGALIVGQQLSFLGASVETSLAVARSALRRSSMQEKNRLAQERSAMLAFQQTQGQRDLQRLKVGLPSLPTEGLTPVPCSQGMCFEAAPQTMSLVSNAVAWATNHREANTSASMQRFWDRLHSTLMETTRPPIEGSNNKPSECALAGRCLCTCEDGKRVRSLKNAFLRAMKEVFRPETEERAKLVSGQIVVQLEGRPKEDDEDAFLQSQDPITTAFFHIGMMYLNPYRPSFMLLDQREDSDGLGRASKLELQARRVWGRDTFPMLQGGARPNTCDLATEVGPREWKVFVPPSVIPLNSKFPTLHKVHLAIW